MTRRRHRLSASPCRDGKARDEDECDIGDEPFEWEGVTYPWTVEASWRDLGMWDEETVERLAIQPSTIGAGPWLGGLAAWLRTPDTSPSRGAGGSGEEISERKERA